MKKNNFKKNSGFTLVEIMVASAVFIVIMVAAMGSLLVSNNAAKKARALRAAMDNVNYAMENMSRNLRLGSNYVCSSSVSLPVSSPQDCPLGNSAISFIPADNNQTSIIGPLPFIDIGFYLGQKPSLNNPSQNIGVVVKCDFNSCVEITSPEVDVTDLKFIVTGTGADLIQPSVYIAMQGNVNIKGEITEFSLQTLASQRNAE
jgi:type II secretory pathway pseudopilin PulG